MFRSANLGGRLGRASAKRRYGLRLPERRDLVFGTCTRKTPKADYRSRASLTRKRKAADALGERWPQSHRRGPRIPRRPILAIHRPPDRPTARGSPGAAPSVPGSVTHRVTLREGLQPRANGRRRVGCCRVLGAPHTDRRVTVVIEIEERRAQHVIGGLDAHDRVGESLFQPEVPWPCLLQQILHLVLKESI